MTPKKHVVLVAGYDYSWQSHNPVRHMPFDQYCRNRMFRLVKKDSTLTFTIFDVGLGKVTQTKLDKDGHVILNKDKSPVEYVLPLPGKTFRPIDDKQDYTDFTINGDIHRILTKPKGIISVADIYMFIQNIAVQKDSVTELSFFAHGYPSGPILVNTWRVGTPYNPANIDLDPRKDNFVDPTIPEYLKGSKKDLLKNAFAKDGFVWCWGCAFVKIYNQMIFQIVNHPAYVKMKNKTAKDRRFEEFPKIPVLNFNFDPKDFKEDIHPWAPDFFPFVPQNAKGEYPFKKNGAQIKNFFNKHLDNTFFKAIANNLNIKCYAPFIGTYADEESHVRPVPQKPVMIIPREHLEKNGISKGGFTDEFTRWIEFYTLDLGKKDNLSLDILMRLHPLNK
jgi:hypothetical protein